jgi:hypothetical protein
MFIWVGVCDPVQVGEEKRREMQWQPNTKPTQPKQSLLLIPPNSLRRVHSILLKQQHIAAHGVLQLRMSFVMADSLAVASEETSSF